MLVNRGHTHCLRVTFLFHWQIYRQQPSSTSSPHDKKKKAEWISREQTSVNDVKNKTSFLNRITIVFHHCLFDLNISVETNYVWVRWFVWNTRSFPQRSYLEKCVSNTVIYCEMSFIKKKMPCTWVAVSCCTPFYFWKHLDIVRHIEFKNAFPQIRSRERKFKQRLARGLFWSRLSNLITIPDWLKLEKGWANFSAMFQSIAHSLPSAAKDDRKQFPCLNIVLNSKTGPLFL